MILEFGKYRGYQITEVPEDYLRYLQRTSRETLEAATEELARRDLEKYANLSVTQQIVEAGFKALAMKCHPDTGGKHEDMVKLNASVEKLRRIVKEQGSS